jgi:hypothetical protein
VSKERCIILVDGSNFFFKLKDLGLHSLLQFDFSAFGDYLRGDDPPTTAIYFAGKIKTDGSKRDKKLHANQQRLLSHLKTSCRITTSKPKISLCEAPNRPPSS